MPLYFETEKTYRSKTMLVPPVSAAYYKLVFPCFVGVYLCANVILQRWVSLPNASGPNMKATECKIILSLILYSARSWYIISQENRLVIHLYSFLGQEYSFLNTIHSILFIFNTINTMQSLLIKSLIKLKLLLPQKRALVKVLG